MDQGNLIKFGLTCKGTQCFQCKTCRKTFVENEVRFSTPPHHSPETILECLAMLAERSRLATIHRIKGSKEETVIWWLREAANHVEEIESLVLANYQLTRVQLDAM